MAEKKTLSAKEVVADVRAAATDDFLMKKYGLTEKGLQSLFQKLIAAKLVTPADLDRRAFVQEVEAATVEKDDAKPVSPPRGIVLKPTTPISQESGPARTGGEETAKQTDPAIIRGRPKESNIFKGVIIAAVLIGAITIPLLLLPQTILLGLFLDFAVNVAVWLLISCFVAFIIAKIRKAESTKTYFQKAAWVALIIAVLATIPSVVRTFRKPIIQPASSSQLTEQQKRRFQEIIKGVMGNPSFLTPSVRQEFHQILAKMGGSPEQIQDLREKMTGVLTAYQPLFWQDALIACQTGKPHKSRQREDYEKGMIAKGLLSTERIKKTTTSYLR